MSNKSKPEAQNPLILRSHRLMEAFAKSDDERDFYLDRYEGFIIYVDLDKPQAEIQALEQELKSNEERYGLIPKLTFYETKKIMEGFVNEKVYDIDTKEKLLDIIQSKEARENFLEFIYDHHSEYEKWQLYYQERSRIRIIEWLRNNHFHFVFEEDLDLPKPLIEKLKRELFQSKVGKDIATARKGLVSKAKTYYSNEALNPRPKRGRPPKQAIKQEVETHITTDIYTTVPNAVRPFLFTPDISSASAVTFSSKFDTEEQMLASRRLHALSDTDLANDSINQKLALLRGLSSKWVKDDEPANPKVSLKEDAKKGFFKGDDDEDEDDDEDDDEDLDDEDDEDNEDSLNGFEPPKKKKAPPPAKAKTNGKRSIIKPKPPAAPKPKKKAPAPIAAAPKKTKLRPAKKLKPEKTTGKTAPAKTKR